MNSSLVNQIYVLQGNLKGSVSGLASPKKSTVEIVNLIRQSDEFFKVVQSYFDTATSSRSVQIPAIIKRHVKDFLNNKRPSIEAYCDKSIQQMNSLLDQLTTRSVNMDVTYKQQLENEKAKLEQSIQQAQKQNETSVKDIRQKCEEELAQLQKDFDKTAKDLELRLVSEVERVGTHLQKVLLDKKEALDMTHRALTKATEEAQEASNKREAEFHKIIEENNKQLATHSAEIESKLAETEKKAKKLKEKATQLFETHKSLGPEIQERWSERQEELNERFKQSDMLFENEMKEKQLLLKRLEEELSEINQRLADQDRLDNQELLRLNSEHDDQMKKIIDQRSVEVDKAVNESRGKMEGRVKRLCENLEMLKHAMQQDKENMNNTFEDKAKSDQERIKTMEDEHKHYIQTIQQETESVKEEQEKVKEEWNKQRVAIQASYSQNLMSIDKKTERENRYYKAKSEALKQELHQIVQENAALTVEYDSVNREIEALDLENRKIEKDFANKQSLESSARVKEKVRVKLDELKEKHKSEIKALISENRHLEKIVNDLSNEASMISSQASTSRPTISNTPSFTSTRYLDAKIEKWRDDFFVDCKLLKQEEADALKDLDTSKVEFRDAMARTASLKKQLESTTNFYKREIDVAKGKSEGELEQLKIVLEQKEKEIVQLESEYQANEAELHHMVKQIEQAEDKLSSLRTQLANEKVKIKAIIKKEYQPLIQQEQKKTEEVVAQLEQLQNEMELQVEYTQHDLFIVETSNAAMEESLRQETDQKVSELEETLRKELSEIEGKEVQRLRDELILFLEESNQIQGENEKEELKLKARLEAKLKQIKAKQTKEITKINDACIAAIEQNSQFKQQIHDLLNTPCQNCPNLQKKIHAYEKRLIKMQEEERALILDDENKRETFRTLKPKTKKPLPPLRE